MRMAVVILSLVVPVSLSANGVSDDFAAGFGGVRWGTDLAALVEQFPGGYEEFSTAPGRVSYALNIDDPVLGIPRSGQYVIYGIGADGKVDSIQIQVAYDQTALLLSTIKAKCGAARTLEVEGVVTTYSWSPDHGLGLSIRTTNNHVYGLTTLLIVKFSQTRSHKSS